MLRLIGYSPIIDRTDLNFVISKVIEFSNNSLFVEARHEIES